MRPGEYGNGRNRGPLTATGIKQVQNVAAQMLHAGIEIGSILHSTRTRAKQTAEIVATVFSGEIEIAPHLSLRGERMKIPALLEQTNHDKGILVISHKPDLDDALRYLPTNIRNSGAFYLFGYEYGVAIAAKASPNRPNDWLRFTCTKSASKFTPAK